MLAWVTRPVARLLCIAQMFEGSLPILMAAREKEGGQLVPGGPGARQEDSCDSPRDVRCGKRWHDALAWLMRFEAALSNC